MNEEFNEELISAYLDGELSAEEAARVEEAIEGDPELMKFVEQSRMLGDDLRALPRFEMNSSVADMAIRGAERRMLSNDERAETNQPNTRTWLIGIASFCAAALVLIIASLSYFAGQPPVALNTENERNISPSESEGSGAPNGENAEETENNANRLNAQADSDPAFSDPNSNDAFDSDPLNDAIDAPSAEVTDDLPREMPLDSLENGDAQARKAAPLAPLPEGANPAPAALAPAEAQPSIAHNSIARNPGAPAPEAVPTPSAEPAAPSAPAAEVENSPQASAPLLANSAPNSPNNSAVPKQEDQKPELGDRARLTAQLDLTPAVLQQKLASNAKTKDLILKVASRSQPDPFASESQVATIEVTPDQLMAIRRLLADEKIAWASDPLAARKLQQPKANIPSLQALDIPKNGGARNRNAVIPKGNNGLPADIAADGAPSRVAEAANAPSVARPSQDAKPEPNVKRAEIPDLDQFADLAANKIQIQFVFRVGDSTIDADANASEQPGVDEK